MLGSCHRIDDTIVAGTICPRAGDGGKQVPLPLQSMPVSHVVAPEDLAGCEEVSDEGIYLEGDEQQAEIRRR